MNEKLIVTFNPEKLGIEHILLLVTSNSTSTFVAAVTCAMAEMVYSEDRQEYLSKEEGQAWFLSLSGEQIIDEVEKFLKSVQEYTELEKTYKTA